MTLEERLERYLGREPRVHPSAYIAPAATVIGDVSIGASASVWPGSVLRGDINSIEIGEASNLQDGCVVHLSDDFGVVVGRRVTVGHLAMLHACTIEDECLIGMHSTVLDGARVGRQSIIGAHALVTRGMKIPPQSLVLGVPGKVVRSLTEEECARLPAMAEKYVTVAAAHRRGGSSDG